MLAKACLGRRGFLAVGTACRMLPVDLLLHPLTATVELERHLTTVFLLGSYAAQESGMA